LNNLKKVKGKIRRKKQEEEEEILYIKYLCVLNGGLSVRRRKENSGQGGK
jgi:hypothetical protein